MLSRSDTHTKTFHSTLDHEVLGWRIMFIHPQQTEFSFTNFWLNLWTKIVCHICEINLLYFLYPLWRFVFICTIFRRMLLLLRRLIFALWLTFRNACRFDAIKNILQTRNSIHKSNSFNDNCCIICPFENIKFVNEQPKYFIENANEWKQSKTSSRGVVNTFFCECRWCDRFWKALHKNIHFDSFEFFFFW